MLNTIGHDEACSLSNPLLTRASLASEAIALQLAARNDEAKNPMGGRTSFVHAAQDPLPPVTDYRFVVWTASSTLRNM